MKNQKRKLKKRNNRRLSEDGNLTYRQQRFVDEYIIDYDGRRAAIAAGYGKRGAHVRASELLQKDKIKKAIDEKQKKIAKKLSLSKEKVLSDLELTRQKALEKGSYHSAAKCSELHGKHLSMFTDKQLHGEDPDNRFSYERQQALEKSLLEKLEILANGYPSEVIDVEPEGRRMLTHEPERKSVMKSKSKRTLKHKPKKRRSYFKPNDFEKTDKFREPDFDPEIEEGGGYCPSPIRDKKRKVSFADFEDLNEKAFESRMNNDYF